MRIGIDIMGGDFMPQAPIDGAVKALHKIKDKARLVLFGDRTLIEPELTRHGANPGDFDLVHTESYIAMGDNPTRAITQKLDATINLGIQQVKKQEIDAFISAGNTGAMLVASILGLGKIDGVNRPTIGVLFPDKNGKLSLLCDVGANVDCKAETLMHFGMLGSVYMQAALKVESPRVALINIGEEEKKGPGVIQEAHQKLKGNPKVNFIGNAEGRDLYSGVADVYVCDGFAGNIILKFGESFYDILKTRYSSDEFVETYNFENYGGVPILGINGVSIIGHGISTGKAIENMVYRAIESVEGQVPAKIKTAFAEIH